MRGRGFYIALGIFAAAVLLFVLLEVEKIGTGSSPKAQASPSPSALVDAHSADIQRVVIKSAAKGKQLVVLHSGSQWTYGVCPSTQADCPASAADPVKAQVLAAEIVTLQPAHVIFEPEALAVYGVDKATTGEVDFTAKDQAHTLVVGGKTPDGASYYAHLDSSAEVIVLAATTVDGTLLGAIDSPPAPAPSPSPGVSGSPAPTASPTP